MQEKCTNNYRICGGSMYGTLHRPSHNHHMHRTAKNAAADVNR